MKRLAFFALLAAMIASSCSVLQTGQNPASEVDTQATIDAIVQAAAEQTRAAAQPSPTTAPPSQTAVQPPAASPTPSAAPVTATNVPPSSTPAPNLTTTPGTATSGPTQNVTATAAKPGTLTLTPTLGVLTYGTLPPAVPSARVTVINKSRAQAYISLQNYPANKEQAFLEYPVEGRVKINAPLGYYIYVVWVGGRQFVGEFRLHKNDDLTITIYKDKVEITQ